MADDEVPPRPRRERPLRASDRADLAEHDAPPAPPPSPPTVTTPPVGPPVIEFAALPDEPEREDHVVVSFDGPTAQRRWTIALRIILAIPHFLWAYLINIALSAVAVVAWFAALFTARVPDGMANFLSDGLQYQARVFAYATLLLSDRYPPFAISGTDYAVSIETNPGRLSRASVLFRLILLVPGSIVSMLVGTGAFIATVVGWLIALILGRLPTPLWEANAAVLRYYTRLQAFGLMLTAEQPKGLFGDKPGASSPEVGDGEPDLPERPRIVRLVLSKAGRRLVITYLIVGVVFLGSSFTVGVINGLKTSEAYRKLDASHERLGVAVHTFGTETQRCNFGEGLPCLHSADTALADAFDRFASELSDISFPANIDASALIVDARDCRDALRRMSEASDQASYGRALSAYSEAAQRFDADYSEIAYDAQFNT